MWFDLKNADIYMQDGYSGTAAVNNASGYNTSSTTMVIDGHTGIIPTGVTFTAGADVTVYTVTNHTETTGNTTSITFTPGLVVATTDNEVLTFGPRSIKVKVGEGNVTWNEKRNVEYKKDRGKLDTVRLGDEEPLDVSFEFWWEFITASTGKTPTIEDVLKNRGEAASWVTSAADTCEPYAVDIKIVYTPPCGAEHPEVILLQDFRYESLNHDLKAGNISCQGKCNVKEASVTRTGG